MATTVNINNDLMAKLQLKSDETGLNVDDLVEKCLSDNLDFFDEEMVLRDISSTQMRNEIIDYMEKHGTGDALEISEALKLDVFDVNEIMVELINEGILEEL